MPEVWRSECHGSCASPHYGSNWKQMVAGMEVEKTDGEETSQLLVSGAVEGSEVDINSVR